MKNVQWSMADQPKVPSKILVVEDEWMIRMVAADALREAGSDVIEAADGVEALSILRSGINVDLIFTDVRMPGHIDGMALLDFARTRFPRVPVIVASGHFSPDVALAAGAASFIRKPYRIEDITALVVDHLSERP